MRIESDHALEYWLNTMGQNAAKEARRGRELHGPHHGYHEAWAVLHEEEDELWDEVKRRHPDHAAIEKEAIEATGVPRVTPHELRHTFISILENELECPPAIVAALAGKVHQGVTAAYSHARPKQLAIWMDKLWERVSTKRTTESCRTVHLQTGST